MKRYLGPLRLRARRKIIEAIDQQSAWITRIPDLTGYSEAIRLPYWTGCVLTTGIFGNWKSPKSPFPKMRLSETWKDLGFRWSCVCYRQKRHLWVSVPGKGHRNWSTTSLVEIDDDELPLTFPVIFSATLLWFSTACSGQTVRISR